MTACIQGEKKWRKAELHAHCNLDPLDYKLCTYSAEELIMEASRLGYEILAITCHNKDVWSEALSDYARSRGITLIPGMELSTVKGRHVLAYNFKTRAGNLDTFDKLSSFSRPDTLLVAPHPYFPGPRCLGSLLERNIGTFDAIEVSGFYGAGLDFNRRARGLARTHGKPLVGNSDVHYLWQLDRTFTWIDSEPGVGAVVSAIKEGRVRVESAPLSYLEIARWWTGAVGARVFSRGNGRNGHESRSVEESFDGRDGSQIAG